jgi:hypothetical protein
MKKVLLLTVAGFVLVSAAAYAHMHTGSGGQPTPQHDQGAQQGTTQGMHGGGMMHDMMRMMHGSMHGGSASHGKTKGDDGPSSLAFHGANMKMHSAMDVTYTGNADVDFIKGMIPHHAGAVDMAKIVLAFGKDPEVRKLAETIIKAQESEIALMQDWLKKNAK